MAEKKIIAICQSRGEFETDKDGVMFYKGGEAHAIDIDEEMKFDAFKMEVAEMFNWGTDTMSIKYFLPGNRKTLITISNDKDLMRMIKFHFDCATVNIYVMVGEAPAPEVSNLPASRSSRTSLSQTVMPLDAAVDVVDGTANHPDDVQFVDQLGITHADTQLDIPTEISAVLPLTSSSDEKLVKVAHQWQNNITGVGQRFNSVMEFRETLRKYAIANQFAFKYKKNDSHRVTVKCKAEGCPWRIHASRLSTTQLICIKKMNPAHNCEGGIHTTGYQATRSWVAGIIKEKLKVFPNYKPKDIVNDIKQEYGIQLNYFQAWRGKEIAKEQLQGSYKDAYKQLPSFCEKIMESNPGSLATFTTKDDSSFHRLFVSFHASLYGFQQGCRPLLFLDSIALKSKYQGTLLAANAADGDDGAFPVAFAVVDTETDDNWRWFLLQLKSVMQTLGSITFVADRHKGLKESIAEIFEGSFHGYCLRYLTENLIKDLKGQFSHEVKRLLVEDFYAAAYSAKAEGFQQHADSIKSISTEAYDWVMQSEPDYWANAFFSGARYNHLSSNFGEIFYSWASEAHELPITQMVDVIRGKIMELIFTRRSDSIQWITRLTPSMEEKLEKENLKAHSFQVLLTADSSTFEVLGDTMERVNIDQWDCSCKVWQTTGIPCCHAIAVISCIGRDPYEFCLRHFLVESYRLTYSETLNPVPCTNGAFQNDSAQAEVTVTPPPTRRPPGRPTKKRFGSQETVKRQLQCSRCKGMGHNKSTCKEILMYLQDLDDLKVQLNVTQATADASAASAQSAQLQCLTLLKDLDEKNNSIKEHEDRVKRLAEQLDALQKDLQVREFSQKQLKDEVLRVEHDIMEAVSKAGINKDCELRKILEEVSPKNIENMNKLLSVKDEEITQLRDEIRILSTHYKLKIKELEAQLEKHRKDDQELKKRVLKLEFCLQEARSQTRKLQRMGDRRDKAIKELRDQLAMKEQVLSKNDEKQNFWESSNFKILVSMSMLVLVVFSRR